MQLNRFESLVATKAEAAEVCDFSEPDIKAWGTPVISGKAIRALMLGLKVTLHDDTAARPIAISGVGLRVYGAHITDALDLHYGRASDGSAMPYLSLEHCSFEKSVNLRQAHLKGLSLTGSTLSHLCAEAVIVDGPVDLGGLRSAESEGNETGLGGSGLCWIQLHGARIAGEFQAQGAILVAPEKRADFDADVMIAHYALELGHASIDGSLVLTPDFKASGGIDIALSHVDGHLRGRGVALIAGEGLALRASAADIRGAVLLGPQDRIGADSLPTALTGRVNLFSAKIAGNLEMQGAQIQEFMTIANAHIGGDLHLSSCDGVKNNLAESLHFTCYESIWLNATKIIGNLIMDGALLLGTCNATNIQIQGAALLRAYNGKMSGEDEILPFTCKADVSFFAARIDGSLELNGATLEGDISIQRAEIGTSCLLRAWNGYVKGKQSSKAFVCSGHVDLYGTKILGSLAMGGAQIDGDISAENIEVENSALLRMWKYKADNIEDTLRFICKGDIRFFAAKIKGTLDMSGAIIEGDFSARNAYIGGDAIFALANAVLLGIDESWQFICDGEFSIHSSKIAGSIYLSGARLGGALLAASAEVGGAMIMRARTGKKGGQEATIRFSSKGDISLYAAKIGGNLELDGAQLEGDFSATNAEIGGDLRLCAHAGEYVIAPEVFSCKGEARLYATKITGGLIMRGGRFESSFSAQNACIGGSAFLTAWEGSRNGIDASLNFVCLGDLNIVNIKIILDLYISRSILEGKLNANTAEISGDFWFRPKSLESDLDFQNLRVAKRFGINIGNTKVRRGVKLDLSNGHVGTLSDGNGAAFGKDIRLEMDGFVYDRLETRDTSRYSLARLWKSPVSLSEKTRITLCRFSPWALWPSAFAGLALFAAWYLHKAVSLPQLPFVAVTAVLGLILVLIIIGSLAFIPGFDPRPKIWRQRLNWLKLQYEDRRPGPEGYFPSAYLQLVRSLRYEGEYSAADRVLRERMRLEAQKERFPVKQALLSLYGFCFGYGLSSTRAIITFALCLTLGYAGVVLADQGGHVPVVSLPAHPTPSNATVHLYKTPPALVLDTGNIDTGARPDGVTGEVACGHQIEPAIYAIDLFIPMLDLHQDTRCTVSSLPDAQAWRILFALYGALGWIVTSISILTFTGVLRRYAES